MLKRSLSGILSVLLLLCFAGCDSFADKKQHAMIRWEKATAKAKIPVAREMFEMGRVEAAYKTISKCLLVDPELAEAHLLLGQIHYSEGRFADSRKSLELAAKYDKKLDRAWYWLALVSQRDKNDRAAIEYYNKALDLKPTKVDYIVAIADVYADQSNYEEALAILEDKGDLLVGNPELKLAHADVMLRQGNVEDAIVMYRQALMLKGEDPAVLEALGYCYVISRQWDEAVGVFERLLARCDSDKRRVCLEALAMCTMNNGEYGRALRYYDRLSVDDRDNAELWLKMGQTALGADAPSRAYSCGQKALFLRPGWSDAIALKGCARYLSGDYKSSVTIFEGIISDKKLGGFAWLMMGRCYKQLGESELSEKAYQHASQLNPDSMLVALLINS